MKVCVYAICKNESKFIDKWYESVKEADLIIVGDTGSTDDTIIKLKKYGVKVYKIKINPWRFDKARNAVLKKIPKDIDICFSIDLDEIITPGWKKCIENSWKSNTTRLRYNYNWSFDKYGKPAVNFLIDKIHCRNDYIWKHPVHEVLKYIGSNQEKIDYAYGFEVNHYPDDTKSRSNYLPLLELSVKEDPNDDRNMHYLGREYMYYGMYDESIKTLKKHLLLKSATWKDERCASMRYIARCYKEKQEYGLSREWLYKAIIESPYLREPYVEMAILEYNLQNWLACLHMCNEALKIKERGKTYINENFSWDSTIYDLSSISYYYLGLYKEALEFSEEALRIDPENKRLIDNNKIIKDKINDKK